MTGSERRQKWISILDAAYSSGESVSDWCIEHGPISTRTFYYWSQKLGYTKDRKKTEKHPAGEYRSSDENTVEQVIPASPVFVDISSELHKYTVPPQPLHQAPPVIIQAGCYQIGVQDGFTPQTLAKVLEVIRNA